MLTVRVTSTADDCRATLVAWCFINDRDTVKPRVEQCLLTEVEVT